MALRRLSASLWQMRAMDLFTSHKGPAVVVLLLTAPILEVMRRAFRMPLFGDLRGLLIMATCAFMIATAIVLAAAFFLHLWPFG